MNIQIRVTGLDGDHDLASLHAWLREEPDIRQHAHISLVPAKAGPSDMGAAFEIIQLVVDSGFQALSFALAYATWRSTRPSHSQITIECDDTKVTVDSADRDAVQAIVEALK